MGPWGKREPVPIVPRPSYLNLQISGSFPKTCCYLQRDFRMDFKVDIKYKYWSFSLQSAVSWLQKQKASPIHQCQRATLHHFKHDIIFILYNYSDSVFECDLNFDLNISFKIKHTLLWPIGGVNASFISIIRAFFFFFFCMNEISVLLYVDFTFWAKNSQLQMQG